MNKFYENSKAHGWWDGVTDPAKEIPTKLCLIHSEVSEALEAYRDGHMADEVTIEGKPVGFPSELADIIIRCYDLAGALGIDLDAVIEKKHTFNLGRPFRHGGKAA